MKGSSRGLRSGIDFDQWFGSRLGIDRDTVGRQRRARRQSEANSTLWTAWTFEFAAHLCESRFPFCVLLIKAGEHSFLLQLSFHCSCRSRCTRIWVYWCKASSKCLAAFLNIHLVFVIHDRSFGLTACSTYLQSLTWNFCRSFMNVKQHEWLLLSLDLKSKVFFRVNLLRLPLIDH